MKPLPAPRHPNTVFSSYNQCSLHKEYLDGAEEENLLYLAEEVAFDYDVAVFDKDPTENALRWL
jgi:hypothetical protein